jgi:Cation transporter/ATPase, N-terminus
VAIGAVAWASRVAPTEERTDWYALSVDDTCRRLDVDPAAGLSASEVVARRQRFGPNKLAEEAKEPVWEAFLRQYRDLMQLVLVGAAVVSIVAPHDISTGVVVLGLTVVNALMGLHQEGEAAENAGDGGRHHRRHHPVARPPMAVRLGGCSRGQRKGATGARGRSRLTRSTASHRGPTPKCLEV